MEEQIAWTIKHGDLSAAQKTVDHALERYGRNSLEWLWRFRVLKAQILVSQMDCVDALALLNSDLPLSLATTDIAVRKLIFEGVAYRICQNRDKSEETLVTAEETATRFQPQLLSGVLTARGNLAVDQGNYTVADDTLHRALAFARQWRDRDQEANVLVSLARLATSQRRFDEAVDRSRAALDLSQSLDLQGLVATAEGNLGWNYFELGDFEAALDHYTKGAETSNRKGLPGYSAYWYTGVANSHLALRNYGAAEALAKSTLRSALALKSSQTITECLNDLARIMLATDRISEAEAYNQQALATHDKFGELDSLLSAGRIAAAQKRFVDAEQLFQRVVAEAKADVPLVWQAQAGLAGVRDSQENLPEADKLYQVAIATIEHARDSIDHDELRLSFLSSGIAVYGEYIDFLIRHGRADDALHQADLSRARTLAEGLSTKPATTAQSTPQVRPQQVAQRLRATILVYWLVEKHSYLWAITPTKTEYFTLPPASEIDPLIKNYRDLTLKSTDMLASATEAGEKLYSTLVERAKELIPVGSRVILLPDTTLYGLNFETLIVPDPQPHFWIEDVTVTTASSLSMLASAANRPPPKQKSLLLVGDSVPVPEFGPLPQAATEIQKIQPYFPQIRRTVLQGPQATPSAYLKSQPGRFSYLHFVTHGTASRARPLESAVILSKEPGGESYKLYAREIVAHPLHADLVTISACNGSGTRAYSGEGLVGLSWAFVRAGAHNVIGALWEVSDVSTPQLMDKMYAELAAGKDPATALRNAKLAFLHSHNVFAKPFYWAPFQLYSGS
jgi:CHAT domain-containing protein